MVEFPGDGTVRDSSDGRGRGNGTAALPAGHRTATSGVLGRVSSPQLRQTSATRRRNHRRPPRPLPPHPSWSPALSRPPLRTQLRRLRLPRKRFLALRISVAAVSFTQVSALVRKGTAGTLLGAVGWIVLYLPVLALQQRGTRLSLSGQLASFLAINPAITAALRLFDLSRATGRRLGWAQAGEKQGHLSLVVILAMLLLDFLLLLGLLLLAQTPWRRYISCTEREVESKRLWTPGPGGKASQLPTHARLEVRNLSVVYRSARGVSNVAVKGASFECPGLGVTALLGKNGSGKTSVLSVIAGIRVGAEGRVKLGGLNMARHRSQLVQRIGYCPQYNPLFHQLSVLEHCRFYATVGQHSLASWLHLDSFQLKATPLGVDWLRSQQVLLARLGLWEWRQKRASRLSGGQKRKLALALALAGNSSLVLLDEPTTGLDPSVRKEVAALLQEEGRKRALLLTTHYLSEAEEAADRIVLMHEGHILHKATPAGFKDFFGHFLFLVVALREGDLDQRAKQLRHVAARLAPNALLDPPTGRHFTLRLATDDASWAWYFVWRSHSGVG